MKLTQERIEAIAAKLREMPEVEKKKREYSKQETVRMLHKEITMLQKRGYTLEQIAEVLKGENLIIATPTLKSYLQRAKSVKKTSTQTPHDASVPVPAEKKQPSGSKPSFTPKPDSDDI